MEESKKNYTLFFDEIEKKSCGDILLGKVRKALKKEGIRFLEGFAITDDAFQAFIQENSLERKIAGLIDKWKEGKLSLSKAGRSIRKFILKGDIPKDFSNAALKAYKALGSSEVIVKSFAKDEGFSEEFGVCLHIKGQKALLDACKKGFLALFSDQVIACKEEKGYDLLKPCFSLYIQKKVPSEQESSGTLFTLDKESGFSQAIRICAQWGFNKPFTQEIIDPDEYLIFKPLLGTKNTFPILEKTLGKKPKKIVCKKGNFSKILCSSKEKKSFVLSDKEILQLAVWAKAIESKCGAHMSIEWAKDGVSKKLFIVQAKPEMAPLKTAIPVVESYYLKEEAKILVQGDGVGNKICSGKICKVKDLKDSARFIEGSILAAPKIDFEWIPIIKKASGIITDQGSRTSHAAIAVKELGCPLIVNAKEATKVLKNGQEVTISCAQEKRGVVYEGKLKYIAEKVSLQDLSNTKTHVMLSIGDPTAALNSWKLPAKGVGLARMEFIIANHIQIHPLALIHWNLLNDAKAKAKIARLTEGFEDKREYFIEKLSFGIAKIAAAHFPHPAIVRMSDFKTNEYAKLIGGSQFEPEEENPMLGWRGASRYCHPGYEEAFSLECAAIKRVRNEIGLKNTFIMIPFCRTVKEANSVLKALEKHGLCKGEGLLVFVMCETPSNVILAEEFAKLFDGIFIGSNDLTQLVLAVDRNSERVSQLFDEQNTAVKEMIATAIKKAHKHRCKVGICGQAPSDLSEFIPFLIETGIDSISVAPGSFLTVYKHVAAAEKSL